MQSCSIYSSLSVQMLRPRKKSFTLANFNYFYKRGKQLCHSEQRSITFDPSSRPFVAMGN